MLKNVYLFKVRFKLNCYEKSLMGKKAVFLLIEWQGKCNNNLIKKGILKFSSTFFNWKSCLKGVETV